MRYTALTAILLAATAIAASPVERDDDYAAETPCTTANIPTVTQYPEHDVTITGPHVVKTKTVHRKNHWSPMPTYEAEPEPIYEDEPEPIDEDEPEPIDEPKPIDEPEPIDEPKPTQKPKPTGAPVEPGSYSEQCLQAHNTRRALHGASALVWDDELAKHAQATSETCVFEHSGGPYGENLAAGGDGTPEEFVEGWYKEGVDAGYSFSNGGFSMETGHFTQVVWKGTTRLGCYTAKCPSLGNYLTCEYADAGNVEGQYQENVSDVI